MGLISATLKIVTLISRNLYFPLYEADLTPDPIKPDSRYATGIL